MTTDVPPRMPVKSGAGRTPATDERATEVARTDRRWTNIGLKVVMAVTGFLMLLFLVLHMIGNLKIYFGRADFDHYSDWLRSIATPLLPHAGYLWVQRVGLVVIVLAHIAAAWALTRRDLKARPIHYANKKKARTSYSTQTMRWGGVIILLFVIYHILDLSTLTLNPNGQRGQVYDNVVSDFQLWYVTLIYVVAMLALGLHVEHGLWSAGYTIGVSRPSTQQALRLTSRIVAVLLTAGFIVVPVTVFLGVLK